MLDKLKIDDPVGEYNNDRCYMSTITHPPPLGTIGPNFVANLYVGDNGIAFGLLLAEII